MRVQDKIIVALDVDNVAKAKELVEALSQHVGAFKIGLEFINSMFASLVVPKDDLTATENLFSIRELFRLLDGKIFWDGKLHDIPNTVGGAARAISRMNVKMFNVHASGGREAVRKAVENKNQSEVLGVTLLTSIDSDECKSIFGGSPEKKVLQFAEMLCDEGADGIICSPQEVKILRAQDSFKNLSLITPGVRSYWAAVGDQKRVMTPGEAVKAGVTHIVVGRPVTKPPAEIGTPVDAVKKIIDEIEIAMKEVN